MKIRMIVQPTGLLNGVAWPEAGEEIEVPDVVAVDLLNGGLAEHIEAKAKVEKAIPPKPSTRSRAKKATEKPADAPASTEPPAGSDSGADDS